MDERKLRELISQSESEILEFKVNNDDSERIGKYVSALANSSAMLSRQFSYMIWGISDDKKIIGTTFYPQEKKVRGEPFISWLERNLEPRIVISFEELEVEGHRVVAMVIQMAAGRPVAFNKERYIRSGSSLMKLSDYPEKERELWRSFDARTFEREYAITNCTSADVFSVLDTKSYLALLKYPVESQDEEVLLLMEKDGIIDKIGERYNITNMGAYSFAKTLTAFPELYPHSVRVIRYKGTNKLVTLKEINAEKGVAVGFEELLEQIRNYLPLYEETYDKSGQRIERSDFPPLVIREIVANLIVHQDFSVRGSSSMVEIYDNRVEITNPGAPINEPNRLLDLPPISRNEELANLFKKMHLVEARGSGIDKVIITLEMEQLPAPDISAKENNTVVTLFERKKLVEMNDRERVNAIYYHTSRLFMENQYMTNQSVRERFGLTNKQSALATKVILQAVKRGVVKVYDENAGNKFMQYIPYWAKGHNE